MFHSFLIDQVFSLSFIRIHPIDPSSLLPEDFPVFLPLVTRLIYLFNHSPFIRSFPMPLTSHTTFLYSLVTRFTHTHHTTPFTNAGISFPVDSLDFYHTLLTKSTSTDLTLTFSIFFSYYFKLGDLNSQIL